MKLILSFLVLWPAYSLLAHEAELHFAICEKESEQILQKIQRLGLEKQKEKSQKVFYLDDKKLSLYTQNLVLRLRVKKNNADLIFKARGHLKANGITPGICEWDVYRLSKQKACKLERELSLEEAHEILKNPELIKEKLTTDELSFLNYFGVKFSALPLKSFGPPEIKKIDFSDDWTYEEWIYDQKTILREVSYRAKADDLTSLYRSKVNFLQTENLQLCAKDLQKTKFTLNYYLNSNH